ncbi:MAG TPA: hypothetical protein VGM20_02445 [Gemmatimonadales bacterium]
MSETGIVYVTQVAKLSQRLVARGVRIHPGRDELPRAHVHMKGEFLVDIASQMVRPQTEA